MTSLKALDGYIRKEKDGEIPPAKNIITAVEGGDKIYQEKRREQLPPPPAQQETALHYPPQQQDMMFPPQMPPQMQMLQQIQHQQKEESGDASILTKIYSFVKIFAITYLIVVFFNSSLSLKIMEDNFSGLLMDGEIHSWLSTFMRSLFTTITLMVSYLLF